MRQYVISLTLVGLTGIFSGTAVAGQDGRSEKAASATSVQLGPRAAFLVNDMADSPLKRQLLRCSEGPFRKSDFSIGHRGAALQFPEHTRESYEAGARMGAGILECDVTFTKDLELVCRHSQADLHTTTNILVTPLASKCTQPFTPAVLGPGGQVLVPASAECRTSDITLAEYRTLRGKMDSFNPAAQTPAQYLGGVASFRTDLYSGLTSGHLLTHKESIALFRTLGAKMTPELKSPSVQMPYRRSSGVRAADGGREQPDRPVCLRQGRSSGRIGHHHLDARAVGHPARREQRVLLPDDRQRYQAGRRRDASPGRAGSGRRNSRCVLRLGGPRHLLRKLHGTQGTR